MKLERDAFLRLGMSPHFYVAPVKLGKHVYLDPPKVCAHREGKLRCHLPADDPIHLQPFDDDPAAV